MTAQDFTPGKYRLRVSDYLTLCDAGAFAGVRTELVDGEIIVTGPQYRPHGMLKQDLYDRLRDSLRAKDSGLRPITEVSLALDGHSMPSPDLMLTSEPYGDGPVPSASVALVVEVADSTLAGDLDGKARLYAAAGIPEYWVADLAGRRIVRMWQPGETGYARRDETAFGAPLESATIAGLAVETGGL
jgi:Uma2 family endonuclease